MTDQESLLSWRDSLREVEADGLPGTKHYAEPRSLATLCGLTDLYAVYGEATLCDACNKAAASQGRTA